MALVVRVEDGGELRELGFVSRGDVKGSVGRDGGWLAVRESLVVHAPRKDKAWRVASRPPRMEREDSLHHGPPHITDRYDTLFLALSGLREERESLPDLCLLFGGDVVFLGELRLPCSLCAGAGCA